MREVLGNIGENDRLTQETSVLKSIYSSSIWNDSAWIFGYMSMNGEFNLESLLNRGIREGKMVALPRVDGKVLRFIQVFDMNSSWDVHPYGMREPRDEGMYVDPAGISSSGVLVLVPGLGFDREGFRLGYGGGFYDRLLSALERLSGVRTAACFFQQQLVDTVPREAHDRKLDNLFFLEK